MSVVLSWAVLEAVGSRVDGLTFDELLERLPGRPWRVVMRELEQFVCSGGVVATVDCTVAPPLICWLVPWVVELEAVHKP